MAHVFKKQQGPLCLEGRGSRKRTFWRTGRGRSNPRSYSKDMGFDAKCAGKLLKGRQQGSDIMSLIFCKTGCPLCGEETTGVRDKAGRLIRRLLQLLAGRGSWWFPLGC